MLLTLRPKLKAYKTLQEAADAVENLEKELMNKLSQAVTIHNFVDFEFKMNPCAVMFLRCQNCRWTWYLPMIPWPASKKR